MQFYMCGPYGSKTKEPLVKMGCKESEIVIKKIPPIIPLSEIYEPHEVLNLRDIDTIIKRAERLSLL